MIFRICTESKPNLGTLTGQFFDCFSIVEGTGYWNGVPEKSATIEITVRPYRRGEVYKLAEVIRRDNDQEAVLVQEIQEHASCIQYADHLDVITHL